MDMPTRAFTYPLWKQAAARLVERLAAPLVRSIPRPDRPPRRILIMEPFLLGDTALLAVMLDPLKARFPEAEIHLLISEAWADLYRNDPRVKTVHGWAFPWTRRSGKFRSLIDYKGAWDFARSLRSLDFDIGIDARGDIRSHIVLSLAGCRRRVGYTNYLCSNIRIRGLLLTDSLGDVPMQHVTQINQSLVGRLGCTPSPLPALHAPIHVVEVPRRLVIHVGAGWRFKRWPLDHWVQLMDRIHGSKNWDVLLVGSRAEEGDLHSLDAQTGGRCTVRVTTSLTDLMAAFASAQLILCHDSGPMNVAVMMNRPVLALFGPGVLPLYRPLSTGSVVVHRQPDFPCAPCNQQRCIRPYDPCMKAITVDEVWRELAKWDAR